MDGASPVVNQQSSAESKIRLFRSLFRGRDDVYPRRFESRKTGKSGYAPACSNEWVRGICEKPRIKCAVCQHRRFLPVTEDVIRCHLSGEDEHRQPFVAGVYPLLLDESCCFLAADFDKANWQDDATAFLQTCRRLDLDAALERSRSGRGGHVWIFFEQAISAALARRLGSHLLTETMEERPDRRADSAISSPCLCKKGRASAATASFSTSVSCHGPTSRRFWHASARSDARRSNTSCKRPSAAGAFSAFGCRHGKTATTNRGPWRRPVALARHRSLATSPQRWS